MSSNITEMPNIEQEKNIAQLENLRRNIDTLIETNKLIAKIRRASFLALVESGFTAEQALVLCK